MLADYLIVGCFLVFALHCKKGNFLDVRWNGVCVAPDS